MNKFVNVIANIAAVAYFFVFMILCIVLMIQQPIAAVVDIGNIKELGFSTTVSDRAMSMSMVGLFLGISLFVPALRRMYYKLPWLLPYTKIMYCTMIIFCIANIIYAKGYETVNDAVHSQYSTIILIVIIACRITMCFYFYKRPVNVMEETDASKAGR